MKTLILSFHPDLASSTTNAALLHAARAVPGVEIVDMPALYPAGRLDMATDGAVEARRLLAAQRIVLQFPVQWYSTPPLLQAWMDAVLTRMYYVAHAEEGALLEGTPIMIAATAGGEPAAYTPGGQNLLPLTDLLSPLRAMAHRCGLRWATPFLVHGAGRLDAADLAAAAAAYGERLRAWDTENTAIAA